MTATAPKTTSVTAQYASLVAEWPLNGPNPKGDTIVDNTIASDMTGVLKDCRNPHTPITQLYRTAGNLPSGNMSKSQVLHFIDTNTEINTVQVPVANDPYRLLELQQNFSVEVWARFPDEPYLSKEQADAVQVQGEVILSKCISGSIDPKNQYLQFPAYALTTYRGTGGIYFYVFTTAGGALSPNGRTQNDKDWADKWHHIAGTYDGATIKIWVDGKYRGGTPHNGLIEYGPTKWTSSDFFIGGQGVQCDPQKLFVGFNGDLAMVRVWDGVLSEMDVKDHYQREF